MFLNGQPLKGAKVYILAGNSNLDGKFKRTLGRKFKIQMMTSQTHERVKGGQYRRKTRGMTSHTGMGREGMASQRPAPLTVRNGNKTGFFL